MQTSETAAQASDRSVGSRGGARAVMEAYLDALVKNGDYGAYLADDVTFTMTETGEVTRGRAAVVGLIDYLHQQAFTATPVVKSVIVDATQAALEGEFAGIPATGRKVRVPYAVGYDVTGEMITAVRIYLPMDELVRQIRDS